MESDQSNFELIEACHWLRQGERRQIVLRRLRQPMTAKQLAHLTGVRPDCCSHVLWELGLYGLVHCLNPRARQGRLYWLTALGRKCQSRFLREQGLPPCEARFPTVDWETYGWVCFRHRSAVIRGLTEPMQPAALRRRALAKNPRLRMSANNVRDVIRLLFHRGIVRQVKARGRARPLYELSDVGLKLQSLLNHAQA